MDKLEKLKDLDKRATGGPWSRYHSSDYYHGDWNIPEIGASCIDKEDDAELTTTYRNETPKLIALLEMAEEKLLRTGATLRHYEILDGGHEAFCQRTENEQAIAAIKAYRKGTDE